LVASYDLWLGNGAGLFSKEKASKEKVKKERIGGEAYNANKQRMYIAWKSTNESRAQYSSEPTRDQPFLMRRWTRDGREVELFMPAVG